MVFPKMASTTSPRDAPSKNVEISNVSRTSEKEKKNVSEENKIEFALPNLIYGIVLHSAAIYGLYLAFTSAKILTVILGEQKKTCCTICEINIHIGYIYSFDKILVKYNQYRIRI